MSAGVEFRAENLFFKSGFGDGDMLDDLLWDNGFDNEPRRDEDHLGFEHEVLARCVERFLLPALPEPVATYRIGSIHNPIRAETVKGYTAPVPDSLVGFGVEVPVRAILEIAAEVRAERA